MLDLMSRESGVFDAVRQGEVMLKRYLIAGIFRNALPDFKALREFEWIGYPELQADMVKTILQTHPNLDKLGLM